MSIRFNHSTNNIIATDSTLITIESGSPSNPKSLKIDSSSVVFPNKRLPVGESGAVVFDIQSQTLKYHNGFRWIELLSQEDILAPVNISLTDIYNQLDNKVQTVTYSSSTVPSAGISGTNLNIIFPSSTSGGDIGVPGLFTSSPVGSIMHYSLLSGQSVSSIREQMSGVINGQVTRDGTQTSPYVTKTGWCFADGNYWTWNGVDGAITVLVPNLNRNAYLKGITTSGITKTDSVITSTGTIGNTTVDLPRHFHGTGAVYGDDAVLINGKTWNDGFNYNGRTSWGDNFQQNNVQPLSGNDIFNSTSTSFPIYDGGTTTASITHTHQLTGIDVDHFNVAILYNIAEPSLALNEQHGDVRYVKKTGDIMTGSLTIANSATIKSNDTSLMLWFRNSTDVERAAIYHNSTSNTLRFRSNGGNEMSLSSTGTLTIPTNAVVNNKNVVRSINNTNVADTNGNVQIQLFTGLLDMSYVYDTVDSGNKTFDIVIPVNCTKIIIISNCSGQAFLGGTTSHSIIINGTTYTGFAYGSRDGSSGHGYYASRPYPLIAEVTGTFTTNQVVQMQTTFNGSWNNIRAYTIYFKI